MSDFNLGRAFGRARCSRCGAFAKREELTPPDVFMGFHPMHKPGPRGGDKCRAIIRKRVWRAIWTRKRKTEEKRRAKELATLLGFNPFG